MIYVTDTHALVYYASEKWNKLGSRARKIYKAADDEKAVIHVPVVCLWEVVLLMEAGRVRLSPSFPEWCRSLERKPTFIIEPLDWMDVDEARAAGYDDPFDRLIVGTARRLKLPLLSKDERISESGLVEVIW